MFFFLDKHFLDLWTANAVLQIIGGAVGLRGAYRAADKHSRRSRHYTMLIYVLSMFAIWGVQIYAQFSYAEQSDQVMQQCLGKTIDAGFAMKYNPFPTHNML